MKVISRVIERLVHKHRFSRSENVLAIGFRLANEGAQTTLNGLETFYPNTLIDHLKAPQWQILHSKIGDDAMSKIMEHCSVFVRLPDGAHLQVTGPPVSELQDSKKNSKESSTGFDRHQMFYNLSSSNKFKQHFTRLTLDQVTATVFCGKNKTTSSGKRLERLKKMAQVVRKRIKSCPIDRIFEGNCRVNPLLLDSTNEEDWVSQDEESSNRCLKQSLTSKNMTGTGAISFAQENQQVIGFVWTITKKILPTEILKTKELMSKLRKGKPI